MRNYVFLQIKVESQSQNSSKSIKIHSTSQRKDCLNLLHLWVRQLLTTRKGWELSQCEKLNFLPDIRAGSAQPSLSFCRAGITLMHSSVTSWVTAGNNTGCHSQDPSPLIPALCLHSTTVCTGSPTPALSHILRPARQNIFIIWFLFKTTSWWQGTQGKGIYF